MADTGFIVPTTVTEVETSHLSSSGGQMSWENLNRILSPNTSPYARALIHESVKGESPYQMRIRDFSFGIPSGATIDGIEVKLRYLYNAGHRHDYLKVVTCEVDDSTSSIAAGTTSFNDAKALTNSRWQEDQNNTVPIGVVQEITLGGTSDLWGQNPTASSIDDFNFALHVEELYDSDEAGSYLNIYEISVQVHYTPASLPVQVNDGGTWKSATVYVNDQGTWKMADVSVNDSGTWKQ